MPESWPTKDDINPKEIGINNGATLFQLHEMCDPLFESLLNCDVLEETFNPILGTEDTALTNWVDSKTKIEIYRALIGLAELLGILSTDYGPYLDAKEMPVEDIRARLLRVSNHIYEAKKTTLEGY